VLPAEVQIERDFFSSGTLNQVRSVFRTWSLDEAREWLQAPNQVGVHHSALHSALSGSLLRALISRLALVVWLLVGKQSCANTNGRCRYNGVQIAHCLPASYANSEEPDLT
jgi:hypothetical protein